MASVFINEFHYDNTGTDTGEFIEITGLAGTDLTGWSLFRYNGANGTVYTSPTANETLSGTIADQGNGFGTVVISYPANGLQNGAPDGFALVNNLGEVVQFLSYEGSFAATNGPAVGLTSIDIGISQNGTEAVGSSLQLTGTGSAYEDFTWSATDANTSGAVNAGQTFVGTNPPNPTVFISEIHYDNAGADTGEFVEVTATAGTNLTGYSLVLYNGNGGAPYSTTALDGAVPNEVNGQGAIAFDIVGIQNGSPDGVALVAPDGSVIEFLSYEGSFTAVGGPADGLTSTDIGVSEAGNELAGQSLQLIEAAWTGPAAQTKGTVNDGGNNGGGGDTITLIHDIQGSGAVSPLVGSTVTVEAIVVGDFQNGSSSDNGNLGGFFVQEEDADADADATTSEGLFIFDGSSAPAVDVQMGDRVQVTGTVTEFNGLTELTNVTVSTVSTGSALPTAATVNLPVNSVADLESFEGMQVTIPDTLFVTEYFNLDRFGEIVLSSNGATNAPGTDGRLDQYTQFNDPDAAGFAAYQAEIAKRRIVVDDGQTIQNPNPIILGRGGEPLSATNTLRGGDTIAGLTGVLSYGFNEYRIQPVAPVDFQPTNPRPDTPEDVGGDLKVVSLNVLNFFTTLDVSGNPGSGPNRLAPRGADSQDEFNRQLTKLITTLEIANADIYGLVELENEFNRDQNGDGKVALETIVDALNERVGAGTYASVNPGVPFVDTGDAISVGAIYKTSTVKIASGTSVEILSDADLPALGLSGPVFDGNNTNRAALAVTFEEIATGEALTVAVNHFKSKGGTGMGDDADTGDGQGSFNGTRLRAATALNAWLGTDPTGSDDADFLLIGDLNSYAQEDPITYLESQGYTNVINNPESAYSYVFDGQLGTLDYGLASTTLISQVTGATDWHINADEPDALDYNLDFGRDPALFDGQTPFRTSDHDPLIVGLDLLTPGVVINGGNGKDPITGSNGNDILTGGNGKDAILGGNGRDILNGGNGKDILIGGRGDDLLTGGNGNDTFVIALNNGMDTITDFAVGKDLIGLSGGLTFGSLSISTLDGNTLISDGAETLAQLLGVNGLSQSAFVIV